jgi:hypothetical protein
MASARQRSGLIRIALARKAYRVFEPEVRSEGQSCGNLSPLTVSAHANEAWSERTRKGLYAMVSKRSRGEADLRAAARQRVDEHFQPRRRQP